MADLKVEDFNIETVMGRAEITLPREGLKNGRVNMVMGQLIIYVPQGANVRIISNTVMVPPISIPAGFKRDGKEIVSPNSDKGTPMTIELENVMGTVSIQTR